MPTIDNKIVQMTFDNQQFERGVAESLKSLEALKKGLELDKAVDSLSNLEKTANSFDISGIAKGVEQVADKFTFLGKIAQNVYDDIYRAGKQAISGMINTITAMPNAGFSKYETKNKAVQMIQSALPEETIENIEAVLGRLNDYTDATSYDFSQMAQSIGKFTSSGVKLDAAERAMEGIANVTASAGGEIYQANIAMYNFSQAIAAGAVKVADWKSIEYQNIATKEFKEQIIETAYELGTLRKVQDKVGQTAKGTTVDFNSFRNTLAEGWFTTDVLIAVLEKYADTETDVGLKAFKAAQEAITLQQAIDAVKDALSTGWMKTWELLFGNLKEATALFTNLTEQILTITEPFSKFRNEVLEGWHNGVALTDEEDAEVISGYALAVETLGYAFEILTGFIRTAADAFADVFGLIDSKGLVSITQQIHDAVKNAHDLFGSYEETIRTTEQVTKEAVVATREWSGALSSGTKGSQSEVKKMQELFIQLNKDTDTFGDKFKDVVLTNFGADGLFGKETEEAVKAFQKAVGISITGIFDEETQKKLDEYLTPELNTDSVREWSGALKKGARDADVKSMQRLFMLLNSDTERFGDKFKDVVLTNFGADGIFGKETEAAVKAFQKAMELPETGIFDKQTQEALDKVLYPEGKKETVYQTVEETIYRINPGLVKFRSIVRGVLSVVRVGVNLGKAALSIIGSVVKAVMPVVNGAFTLAAGVADVVSVLLDFISVFDLAGTALSVFDFILVPVSNALSTFGGFLSSIGEGLSTIAGLLRQGLGLEEIREQLEADPKANAGALMIYNLFVKLQGIIETVTPYIETAKAVLVSLFTTAYTWVSGKLIDAFNNIKSVIDAFKKGGFENAFGRVIRLLSKSKIGSKFVGPLLKLKSGIKNIVNGITNFGSAAIDIFTKLRKGMSLDEIFDDLMRNPEKNRTAIGIVNFLIRLGNTFEKIKGAAKDFKNAVAPTLESVWTKLKGFGTNLWNSLVDFFTPEEGKTFFESIGDKISGWAESAWANIVEFFVPGEDGKGLLDHINEGISTISTALETKKTELITWWGTFSQNPIVVTVTDFLSSIWSGIINWLVPGKNGGEMSQYVDENVEIIKGSFENVHSGIGSWWNGIISSPVIAKIVDWTESAWANAVEWFLPGKDGHGVIDHIKFGILMMRYRFIALKYKIKGIWDDIKQNPVIAKIVDWTESAWANVVEFFTAGDDGKGLVENIKEAFKKIKMRINLKIWSIRRWWDHDVLKTPIIAAIADWTKSAWANIVGFFTPTIEDTDVGTYIARRVEEIRKAISEAWNNVTTWFETVRAENPVINTVATTIESAWGKIVEVLTSAWNKVNELVTMNPETGKTPIQEFLGNANSIFDPIVGVFSGFAGAVTEAFGMIQDAFERASSEGGVFSWIRSFIEGMLDRFGDADLGDLLSTVNTVLTGTLITFITSKIANLFGGWTNIFQNIVSGMSGGKFQFFSNSKTSFGDTVLKIGLGILSMGAAVALVIDAVKRLHNLVTEIGKDEVDNTVELIKTIFWGLGSLTGVGGVLSIAKSRIGGNGGFSIDGALNVAAAVWIMVDAITKLHDYTKDFKLLDWGNLQVAIDKIKDLVQMFMIFEGVTDVASDVVGAVSNALSGNMFSRDALGALTSGSGAVGIAYAIEIIVGVLDDLMELCYGGKYGSFNDNDFSKVEKVLGQVKGLIGVLGTTSVAVGAFTRNAWGQISSGSGAVLVAVAIEIIIDAVRRLANLAYKTEGFDFEKITGIIGQIEGLVSVLNLTNAVTGAASWKTSSAFGILFSGLSALFQGFAVSGIIHSVTNALTEIQKSGIDTAHIDSFASFLNVLVGIIEAGNSVSSIIAAVNPLSFLGSLGNAGATWIGGEAIASLARGLSDALVSIKDVPVESIDKFSNFLNSLYGLINDESLTSGWSGLGLIEAAGSAGVETAIQAFTHFTNAIFLAGSDIASFERDTRDISDWSIFDTAATNLSTMITTISSITKADDAATILGTIGGALALYGMNIAGISIDETGNIDTKTLEDVFTALAGVFESDSATAAIAAIAPGDGSAVSDFSVGVVNLATALESYSQNIGGLDPDKVATANDLLKTVAGLDLPTEGTWWGFLTGKQTLSQFAGNLTNIGEGVAGFSRALEGFHPEDGIVTAALDVIGTLVGYATSLDSLGSQYMNFDTLRESFTGFFSGLENYLADPYGGNYDSASLLAYSEAAVSLLTAIATGLSQNIGILETAVGNVLTTMDTDFNAKQDWWYKIGMNIDYGMAEGIYKGSADPVIAALAVSKAIWSVVSAFFGIASPSKEFAWVGQMVDAGLAQGLTQYSNVVESASEDVAQATLNGYDTGILNSISDTPVIRPVLDLSDVTSGVATMSGMFGNYNVGVTSSGIATRIASEGTLSIGGSGAQDLVGAVSDLNDRVDQLTFAISNMKVVTETGAIIGAISTGIDIQLGENEFYDSRGI